MQSRPTWFPSTTAPFLPRAFSIGGLVRCGETSDIVVIYRVVGRATRWMESLTPGSRVRVLGPLGNAFPIYDSKPRALLVIGGVGLPPLLWLAEALHRAGKPTVALLGARSVDLVPLDMAGRPSPGSNGQSPVMCSSEFAAVGVPVVVSTDDGSCGYCGNVVSALEAYCDTGRIDYETVVVYACGPEAMMAATARFCAHRAIECIVCMERPMACGLGTCQSCIVTVRSAGCQSGRRYALCCTDGPVFRAEEIIWPE